MVLNSTRLAKFWMVLVTNFSVRSAMGLGRSGERERGLLLAAAKEGQGLVTCHNIKELRFEQGRTDKPQEEKTTEVRKVMWIEGIVQHRIILNDHRLKETPYLTALIVTESSSGHF